MRKAKSSKKVVNPSDSISSESMLLHIHMVEAHVRVADFMNGSSDPYAKLKLGSAKQKNTDY